MKKQRQKLVLHRETLRKLSHGELRRVPGGSGESECVSNCLSDTFPGNCPGSWNGSCFSCAGEYCTLTSIEN
jgi:hypothetical protein